MIVSAFPPLPLEVVQDERGRLECMFRDFASGTPSEFYADWDKSKTAHLPLSLTVLRDPQANVHQKSDATPPGVPSAVWRSHRRYRESSSDEKTLLLITGFSFEQLVLSMALHVIAFGCGRVIPVSTKYAWGKSGNGAEIKKWWDALRSKASDLPDWDSLVRSNELLMVQEHSPSDVFKQIRGWLKKYPSRRAHVAIDATGGTKPMDSGASACAAYYDLPAYYIHTTEYNSDLRRPLPHSATYSLLDRPSATFSQASRESVYQAFVNRDFALAGALAGQLTSQIRDGGEFHDYFDGDDRRSCEALTQLIQCSSNWLTLGYCPVCPVLPAGEASRWHPRGDSSIDSFLRTHAVAKTDPREIIRGLREGSRTEAGWKLSMQYFVCEYYRLCCLMNRDPAEIGSSDRDRKPPPPSAENVREVLTVGYGLAESLIDSMLYLLPCWRRMHVQWKGQDPRLAANDGVTWSKLCDWGWISPDPDFFHLNYDKKIGILCGCQTFKDVWPIKTPVPGSYDNDDLRKVVQLATHDAHFPVLRGRPPDKEPAFKCNVTIKLRTSGAIAHKPAILGGGDQKWTAFLGIREKAWTEARNAITHVRVPVTTTMIDTANKAVNEYLPRLIELYRRIAAVPVDARGNEIVADGARLELVPVRKSTRSRDFREKFAKNLLEDETLLPCAA